MDDASAAPSCDLTSGNENTLVNHEPSTSSSEAQTDAAPSINAVDDTASSVETEAPQQQPLDEALQRCNLEDSNPISSPSTDESPNSSCDRNTCQSKDNPPSQTSPSSNPPNAESDHPTPTCQNAHTPENDVSGNHSETIPRGPRTPEPEESDHLSGVDIEYSNYENELQMPEIMQLIQKDLSEPYSIYTYRYFINNWPNLCFLARSEGRIIGAIVCKLDSHDSHTKRVVTSRGYIAMLAVDKRFRKRRIGSCLVLNAIRAMAAEAADEVVLETEVTNRGALRLYENLGFVRDKRLFRYYLNGVDALRLKLWLWPP